MRVLLDTNVVIDFLEARQQFSMPARAIFEKAADGTFDAYITAKEATDIYYIVAREYHSKERASELLKKLLKLVKVLDTTSADIYASLLENYADFEDGVMAETAKRYKLDAIVTRDPKGFTEQALPVYSSTEFAGILRVATN